jgi:D-alanyl-D-alanine carboxypeptidase (penicillin-binding protein 5/6)
VAPFDVTLQVESRAAMKVTLAYDGPVRAPIEKGQKIGTLHVTAPDFPGAEVPVVAAESVSRSGVFARIYLGLRALLVGQSGG